MPRYQPGPEAPAWVDEFSATLRGSPRRPRTGMAPPRDPANTLTLCVFIDAFGWELLRRHSFLDDLLSVKAPLQTVLGYSCTCDPTILTGRSPREHGHFSFYRYAPQESPFRRLGLLRLLPKAVARRGRVRRLMSRAIARAMGYTGYFQLYNMPFEYLRYFDYTEKRDLYQTGGINSGMPTIFDRLRDRRIKFHLSDWRRSEQHNLAAATESIERREANFVYLYLAAMDGLLHAHGTRSPIITEKIAWYAGQIRQLVDQAEQRYGDVRVFVFSDHGMTDVMDTCDLIPQIESLGLRFGENYAAVYDSTMARFWFKSAAAERRVVATLQAEPRGHILSDDELRRYGCDFPDRRYGELFFLLDPGVLLCPSFMGDKPLAAMHGYDPFHRDSVAMFASNVAVDPMPRGLADINGLMIRESGVAA